MPLELHRQRQGNAIYQWLSTDENCPDLLSDMLGTNIDQTLMCACMHVCV